MEHSYTLYIDESGDAGIERIKGETDRGASPYMSFGAALVVNSEREEIRKKLVYIAELFNKKRLHCSGLKHYQKIRYIREIKDSRMMLFSVLSLKKTLGSYREEIDRDHQKYYNKCAQYLLEKVGRFIGDKGINPKKVMIVFEDAGYNYNQLKNFLHRCRNKPLHAETKFLQNIDPEQIRFIKKEDDKLLELADLVAHSIYKCADKSEHNYSIPEPRYFRELSQKFYFCLKTKKIEGFGFKSVHKLQDLKLDEDVENLISTLLQAKI